MSEIESVEQTMLKAQEQNLSKTKLLALMLKDVNSRLALAQLQISELEKRVERLEQE